MTNKPTSKKEMPLFAAIILDILIAGVILCVFAYFHHVREYKSDVVPETIVPPTVRPHKTPSPTGSGTPDTDDPFSEYEFYEKFAEMFTQGEVIETANSYKSPCVSFTISEHRDEEIGCTYYVADIYIASLDCLSTYLAKETYGTNIVEKGLDMYKESGALLALNGDYYGAREYGPVIRNYKLYRENKASNQDVCLLYYNGVMETFSGEEFSISSAVNGGCYQCWAFGPSLLDKEGKARTSFPSWYKNIGGANPRSAIGYYEPGHYCFVAIDGRTDESAGMSFIEEAKLMESLGCTLAYNLDGGISSFMVYRGEYVNIPPVKKFPNAPRAISDCIIIKDISLSK